MVDPASKPPRSGAAGPAASMQAQILPAPLWPSPSRKARAPRAFFLGMWLKDPFGIGAIAASGRALARSMAAQIDVESKGPVVELGPGSGAITGALLERGIAPGRLLAVERNRTFLKVVRSRFPEVTVVEGDAGELGPLLESRGIAEPLAGIVSGLPLLSMPRTVQRAILHEAGRRLAPGASFVQFTYGPVAPAPRRLLAEAGLVARRVGFALFNAPPASVWCFTRPESDPA